MKSNWLKTLFVRIGDLVIKNLSMKVEAAAIITGIYLADPATAGIVGFVLVSCSWLAVVGFRYLEKVKVGALALLPQRGTE